MNKIGVFGGTFDPVHYGHIWLARQAADELSLDQVIVTPAKNQPFKLDRSITSGEHRYNMLKLAFAEDELILVSDIELKKDSVSYTVDTLREIKKSTGGGAALYFILGADAFLKIEKWKDAGELLREYHFIIGTRPGYKSGELDEFITGLRVRYSVKSYTISNKQIDISSTEIKDLIMTGKAISVVPKEVERYIASNGLYQGIY